MMRKVQSEAGGTAGPIARDERGISRRGVLFTGAAGFGAVVMFAACGRSDNEPNQDAGGNGSPRAGGSLRVANVVPTAFFVGSSYDLGQVAWRQMAWPLFLPSAEGFGVENGLAEDYTMSEGGLLHEIVLREGLTFHDGSPLEAQAVVDNLEAMLDPAHSLRDKEGAYGQAPVVFGDLTLVESIEATDARTLSIRYSAPRGDMRLSLVLAPIVNPAVLSKSDYGTDESALADLGSGPFKISAFSPGAFVEFERFDAFFEPAYLDRLRFELFEDPAAKGLALRSGDIDVALDVTKTDLEAFAKDAAFEVLVADPPSNVHQMFMFGPVRKPELQDMRVREAIILATNRESYVQAFFAEGTASLATQPILAAPGVQGYNETLEARPHDVERAKELLAEADVSGLELEIIGWPAGVTPMDEAIKEDLANVGITANIRKTDQATFLAELYNYDYGITDLPNAGDMYDALGIFFPPDTLAATGDPRATSAAQAVLKRVNESTGDARAVAIQELMRLEHDELLLGVPIAVAAEAAVARSDVKVRGFRVSPSKVDSQNAAWLDA